MPLVRDLQRSTRWVPCRPPRPSAGSHNVRIEPADELAILKAAGNGDSVRAALLGVRIATNVLASAFGSTAATAVAVRPLSRLDGRNHP